MSKMQHISSLALIVVLASTFLVPSSLEAQNVTPLPTVRKTIEQFFSALQRRDAQGVRDAVSEKFVGIEAGNNKPKVNIIDATQDANLLPPEGNTDWNGIKLSTFALMESAPPGVAVVSFTISKPLSNKRLQAMNAVLLDDLPAHEKEGLIQAVRSQLKGIAPMTQLDAQDARISEIIGDDAEATFDDCRDKYYDHLESSLQLPCDVTGIEDFRWEEYYVIGPGDRKEHERLRKNQPSYEDNFELLAIENGVYSEWIMFHGEDVAGHVRRKSDGKEFHLGLAEIEAVNKKSKSYQLLNDYAVWFVNNR